MEKYFQLAIKEANKAYKKNEMPVGAIIVQNNKIIAKAHNRREKNHNVLGHAEILCILKATKKIKDWRLDGCEMYVTLEPCSMCRTIINESRIDKVYFLLNNQKNSVMINKTDILQTNDCNVYRDIYKNMIKNFFNKLRNKVIK